MRYVREMGVPYQEIRARVIGDDVADILQAEILRMRSDGARVLAAERYARPYYVSGRGASMLQSPGLMRAETAGQAWTRAEHVAAARAWLATAYALGSRWDACVREAVVQHGDADGAGRRVLISGVYRDHFPPATKAALRTLARARTWAIDASLAHWIGGAGRRLETWRREKEATGV